MTRRAVKSRHFREQGLVAALKTHVAERTAILDCLLDSVHKDGRVRAAWLWESFQRGEQDDLSDIDLWMLVKDGCEPEMGPAVLNWAKGVGSVVWAGESSRNAPEGGGYLGALLGGSHGFHHLDIYWQAVAAGSSTDGPLTVDRLSQASPSGTPSDTDPVRVEPEMAAKIGFIWLMLSVAGKYLARDRESDMALIAYPRQAFEEVATFLDMEPRESWVPPDDPIEKVDLLRSIASETAVMEQDLRRRHISLSTDAQGCLMRYFDLVELILREGHG